MPPTLYTRPKQIFWIHPNNVFFLDDYGGDESLYYIIENQNLVTITFKIPCLKSVLSGLKYIHEQMFVHLDLKPSNISSNTLNDTWKISDFGASVNLDKQTGNHSSKSVQTAISCTIPFTATEIFIRDTISTKADI